nr:PadR family transcriptional regulator [Cellulosimicrobium arenosum]
MYILGALAEHGPMHGHQLRLLAEKEHATSWTDITVGSLYGALKRLAHDDLIVQLRHEQEGGYPTRQVWQITAAGRNALRAEWSDAFSAVVVRPDPFDLAMARLDADRLDEIPALLRERIAELEAARAAAEAYRADALPYLTVGEKFVLTHRPERLQAEIDWHTALLENLPEIVADELARKDHRP